MPPPLPERLWPRDINAGINQVRGRIESCADRHRFEGIATVKLVVAASGVVERADVLEGSAEFQRCVIDKAELARFPAAQAGTTVRYPFVLR